MAFKKGHPPYLEQTGAKNNRWKGGTTIRHGYRMILIGKNKYIPEHNKIWIQENQMPIPKGCIIHHKNQNRLDNRIENLALLPRSYHTWMHNKIRILNNPEERFLGKNIHLRGD